MSGWRSRPPIDAYTSGAAWASFDEQRKGSHRCRHARRRRRPVRRTSSKRRAAPGVDSGRRDHLRRKDRLPRRARNQLSHSTDFTTLSTTNFVFLPGSPLASAARSVQPGRPRSSPLFAGLPLGQVDDLPASIVSSASGTAVMPVPSIVRSAPMVRRSPRSSMVERHLQLAAVPAVTCTRRLATMPMSAVNGGTRCPS